MVLKHGHKLEVIKTFNIVSRNYSIRAVCFYFFVMATTVLNYLWSKSINIPVIFFLFFLVFKIRQNLLHTLVYCTFSMSLDELHFVFPRNCLASLLRMQLKHRLVIPYLWVPPILRTWRGFGVMLGGAQDLLLPVWGDTMWFQKLS